MTPHNIAGMSYINGLDIIALSDHNSARNIRALSKCAEEFGILVVPAIEAETSEGIHLLCLFPSIDSAESMGEMLEKHLPPVKNRPEIFGEQCIMNELDEKTGTIDKLLINSTDIPVEEMKRIVEEKGGVCVAAHIDRESGGISKILGCVPEELCFKTVELSKRGVIEAESLKYNIIRDSDAHYLTDISEKVNFLELEEKTLDTLLKKLSRN